MIRRFFQRILGPKAESAPKARKAPKRTGRSELDELKAILTRFEGCRLKAYLCPADTYTIGVGATETLGGQPIPEGMVISQAQADALLDRDARKFHTAACRALRDDASRGARIAFSSLMFNMGEAAIKGSHALREYNLGNMDEAERHYLEWRGTHTPAGFKVLPGLVKRRRAEWKLIKEAEQ